MLRTLMAVGMGLLLAGCWQSEEQLFGESDWARLDLDGKYSIDSAPSSLGTRELRDVTLAVREDGLIQSVGEREDGEQEANLFGLVAIPGGSGRFFLGVDRSDETDQEYFLVLLTFADGLVFFMPDCSGTPARVGLVIEDASKGGLICTFATKQAVLEAALEAERFLSVRHIIAVSPIYSLERMEEALEEPPVEEAIDEGEAAE